MAQVVTLFGQEAHKDRFGEWCVTIDGVFYRLFYNVAKDTFEVVAMKKVTMPDGSEKVMKMKELVRFELDYDPDAPLDIQALFYGVQKLKPKVEYRLRELHGEDHLQADPIIDQAIELEQIAKDAAESEALQQHEAWGAWG